MEGIIIKGIGGFYYVRSNSEVIECKARGKFRHTEVTPMVGDRVEFSIDNNKGVITSIMERSSELLRPQVANVNQAFVLFAIKNPDLNFELLNKFLIQCEHKNIKPVICINKIDQGREEDFIKLEECFYKTGYRIFFINAKKGQGIDELRIMLKDRISVLCGPSGAGKSTLMNQLLGTYHMETGNVSDKIGRGKHTTRHSELVEVEHGLLVDTPGFSTLEMDFIEKDFLKDYFPEFHDYESSCKFRGCMHYKEPGCAVMKAAANNEINEERYNFYKKYYEELSQRRNNKW